MNIEVVRAAEALAKEKGISQDVLFGAIEEALKSAYRKNFRKASSRIMPGGLQFRLHHRILRLGRFRSRIRPCSPPGIILETLQLAGSPGRNDLRRIHGIHLEIRNQQTRRRLGNL